MPRRAGRALLLLGLAFQSLAMAQKNEPTITKFERSVPTLAPRDDIPWSQIVSEAISAGKSIIHGIGPPKTTSVSAPTTTPPSTTHPQKTRGADPTKKPQSWRETTTSSSAPTAPPNAASSGDSSTNTLVIALAIVVSFIVVAAVVFFLWFCCRRRRRRKQMLPSSASSVSDAEHGAAISRRRTFKAALNGKSLKSNNGWKQHGELYTIPGPHQEMTESAENRDSAFDRYSPESSDSSTNRTPPEAYNGYSNFSGYDNWNRYSSEYDNGAYNNANGHPRSSRDMEASPVSPIDSTTPVQNYPPPSPWLLPPQHHQSSQPPQPPPPPPPAPPRAYRPMQAPVEIDSVSVPGVPKKSARRGSKTLQHRSLSPLEEEDFDYQHEWDRGRSQRPHPGTGTERTGLEFMLPRRPVRTSL